MDSGEERILDLKVTFFFPLKVITQFPYSYLFPIVESLGQMLVANPPFSPPSLPFDENSVPHDLGVGKVLSALCLFYAL